jgi:AhpD family alkylhydroperoxidase
MRRIALAAAAAVALTGAAQAQDGPPFFTETIPPQSLEGLMSGYGALTGEDSELDYKTLELVALAVAAQIPCDYCVYAHAKNARSAGASEAELREAVAMAGMVRAFSTILNGNSYDFEAFVAEHDAIAPPTN